MTTIVTVYETIKVQETKEKIVTTIRYLISDCGGGYIRLTGEDDNEIYINTKMVVAII